MKTLQEMIAEEGIIDEPAQKIDMFKKREQYPYRDFIFKNYCSKCSRYDKCRRMDPECERSLVTYC